MYRRAPQNTGKGLLAPLKTLLGKPEAPLKTLLVAVEVPLKPLLDNTVIHRFVPIAIR